MLARQEHESRIAGGKLKTGLAQFDEMETFEHTRMKPVTVAIAVRAKTGEILGIRCAELGYKGPHNSGPILRKKMVVVPNLLAIGMDVDAA